MISSGNNGIGNKNYYNKNEKCTESVRLVNTKQIFPEYFSLSAYITGYNTYNMP